MKPAPFEYIAPESVEETLEILAEYGEEAKIIAGGQSLMPLLNMRLATPGVLVDINGLTGLDYIRQERNSLHIGALTRQYRLEEASVIQNLVPILTGAARLIGHPAIRHAGTIGGSLAHADPAAELPAALSALEGEVQVLGSSGARWVAAADFFQNYLTVDLRPDELLTQIRIPVRNNLVWGMREYTRRAGDFAIAGAIVVAEMDGDRCVYARVIAFGVGDRPIRLGPVEAFMLDRSLKGGNADDVANAAVDGLDSHSDLHASAEYRNHLAEVMIRRAYLDVVSMCQQAKV